MVENKWLATLGDQRRPLWKGDIEAQTQRGRKSQTCEDFGSRIFQVDGYGSVKVLKQEQAWRDQNTERNMGGA